MTRSQSRLIWLFPFLLTLLPALAACEREKAPSPTAPLETAKTEEAQPMGAVAELRPTEGGNVSGMVTFTSRDGGVRVVADLEGLEPGKHGFHLHETGDCSAPDASSAGGHFNPDNTPHGAPDNPAAQRHVGDLGNVEAGEDGKAHYEREDKVISLDGPKSIMGKAVIVHAGSDDLNSQPTGNAGPRLACGVIVAQN